MPAFNRSQTMTIKLGGSTMDDARVVHELADDISSVQHGGMTFIVVHGGGKEITREMEARGIKPVKVSGLRITDPATMDTVEAVMRRINQRICGVFQERGLDPEGLIGSEGLLLCERLPPVEPMKGQKVDLGRVGRVTKVDVSMMASSLSRRKIPIVAPIGKEEGGATLNINADTAAGSIAGACSSEFILLTDVDGILVDGGGRKEPARSLSMEEMGKLIRQGTIIEGMLPKAEACMHALKSGVKAARIVNGLTAHPLKKVLEGAQIGTRIIP